MHPLAQLTLLVVLVMPVLSIAAWADAPAEELVEKVQAEEQEHEHLEGLKHDPPEHPEEREHEHHARSERTASDSPFSPGIGIVLNSRISDFSVGESDILGFQLGHEAERVEQGFSLAHSELTASSSFGDQFFGSITVVLDTGEGESADLELEEAYIQTLPGVGLPEGMRIKAGRALWTLGFLNSLHTEEEDFSDRPLPYRVFLDSAYNDDGIELSLILPTDGYGEVGVGRFRGDDIPFSGSDDSWSAYARLGGAIGRDSTWRAGVNVLTGEARNRGGRHADEGEDENEGGHEPHGEREPAAFFSEGVFSGDTRIYILDFRATWMPAGNARERELVFQGEYFWRKEKGTYTLPAEAEGEPDEARYFDDTARGWYLQGVYRFLQKWRIGARYAQLRAPGVAEIGHDPNAFAVMLDWTDNKLGRLRLQYNREGLTDDRHDNQFMLQYILSFGSHGH